jgi:hypothetical protein
MRKRFTKSVLVGTLVVIVSAIVAGPAFGDTQQSGGSSKQQVSSGGDTIPPYVLRTMGKQYMTLDKAKPASIPGYTDFPNALRLHNTLTPTERAQLDAAVANSSGSSSTQQVSSGGDTIPPYVLRTMGKQYMTLDQAKPASIPGYTDFPNALRLHNTLTPTERKQLDAAVASNSSVSSSSDSGFSWSDAGVGIGIGLAIAGGLALLAVFGSRRGKATPVTA